MRSHIHRALLLARLFLVVLFSQSAGDLAAQNISLVGQADPFPASHKYGDVWGTGDIVCVGAFTKYTANPSYGVGIFSITNPAAPVLLANYNPNPAGNNQFEQGVIRDQIGYFANWSGTNGGLHIVSLTNPASPVLLASIGRITGTVTNGHDRVHTLFLNGNFIYLADHLTPTVKVFNVSNPSLPVFVRNIVTTDPERIHQITAAGNRLFTSGWGGHTDIYDVSNVGTQAPPLLGSFESGSQTHSCWPTADGNYLVSCREISGGDVRIFDISDPADAQLVCTMTTAGIGLEGAVPHNPVVVGNLLYISWYQAGLQIFDISDPAKPVRVGAYDTFAPGISTLFEGNWGVDPSLGIDKVLLGDMQRGLLIMDASAVLTGPALAPILLTQPMGLTITQGMTVNFSATASGAGTLSYQWRLNGTNISGATTNSLLMNNVQPENAGSYTLVVANSGGAITSLVANLSVTIPVATQVIFSDDFETNSSAHWSVFAGAGTGGDHTVDWAFDYGTYFSSFHGGTIPPAPNTTNSTTRGVKLTVNADATAAIAGVSLYPTNQFFTNGYTLKFDMWMNYPGGPTGTGSTGSTQTATFGLNHAGTRVNWDASTSTPSDGVWFACHGEGGAARDYRAYVGGTNARPVLLSFANSGIAASGASSDENTASYFQTLFPTPTYETGGSPGKNWVEVEISQTTNNVLAWKINGSLIAQRTNTTAFTNGNIMLGYMDLFASIANPLADAFVLFDNVRVEAVLPVTAPGITSQPQDQTVFPEQDATFSVSVIGGTPLYYQWKFNGTNISGATNASYTRVESEPEHAGFYSVVVSNAAGTVTSSNAVLAMIDSPHINGVTAYAGETTALITWTTDVLSDSQVEYDVHTPHSHGFAPVSGKVPVAYGHGVYNTFSHLDTNLVFTHWLLLTNLEHGTEYGFQVVSRTGSEEFSSAGYHFTTLHHGEPPPAILVPPADQTNAIGTAAAFSVLAEGEPYLFYQWRKNGVPLSDDARVMGAKTATLTVLNVVSNDAGHYQVVISNEFGGATSAPVFLFVSGLDAFIPTVAITTPKANERILNNFAFLLSGTAKDKGMGLAQVLYRLNGGAFQPASGTTNWSAPVTLTAGTNSMQVKAIDFAGNQSTILSRTFFEVFPSPFTLSANGLGSILSISNSLGVPTNGALLEVGRPYTLTATPGPHYILSNWIGTVNFTNLAKITFIMQTNMELTANFVPNPFIAVQGVYNGLFFETNESAGITHHSAGFFSLKLKTNFAYSGKLLLDGDPISFSGKFHVNGTIHQTLPRGKIGKSDLQLSMALDFLNGSDQLTGTISQGTNWSAALTADRNTWSTNNPATAFTNFYTMLLPGSVGVPPGYSYATIAINTNGTLKAVGGMADGQTFSQVVPISKNGDWPFYAQFYKTLRIFTNLLKTTNMAMPVLATNKSYYRGSALGWQAFTPVPTNELSWIKTGWTNAHYPNGFTNQSAVLASVYQPPAKGFRALDVENGTITLSEGNLSAPLVRAFNLKTNNTFTITPTNQLMKFSLTVNSGLLTGSFRHPDNTNAFTLMKGVILQDQKIGGGYFPATNQAGKVLLE